MALFTKFRSIIPLGKWIIPTTFDNMSVSRKMYGKLVQLDQVYEEKFRTKLETNNDLSNEEWKDLRQELINSNSSITKNNIDSIIMNACLLNMNTKAALSYVDFLKSNKYDMNLSTTGKYLKLFSTKDILTDSDKTDILNTIDNILKKYPVLDAMTIQNCISAICMTDRWQEAIKLLDMTSVSDGLTHMAYSYIIVAAFKNGNIELGFKYFSEMLDKYNTYTFKEEVFMTYLTYCNKYIEKDVVEEKIGKMFQFCKSHFINLDRRILKSYVNVYNNIGWTSMYTSLRPDGTCRVCQHQMQPNIVTKEEFLQLSEAILQNVVIGSDVYHNSNPQELDELIKFVNKTKPYGIVIDGLNISYRSPERSLKVLVERLAAVVKYFVDMNVVVMVLGRKHMNSWPKKTMQYIRDNAFVFLADNISQDDPYLLYATLMSGEHTKFISSDFMRQHKYRLNINLKMTFRRWQMSHQYRLITIQKGKAFINKPLSYLPVIQEDVNGWHIPCKDSNESDPLESYTVPKGWICLRRNTSL